MTDADQKLVQAITEQVIRALQQRGQIGGGAGNPHADIKPPAGVCTGDYTQFTERPDLAGQSGDPQNTAATSQPNDQGVVLTGILTANQLQEAVASAPNGVVRLAADARPTPMATDWIREHPEQVQRIAQLNDKHTIVGAEQSKPWLVWVAGQCPAVDAVTSKLANWLQRSAAPRTDAGMAQAVQDLARGVSEKHLAGGLLFVESAALAACYANRCAALRAVVGTAPETVNEAVNKLAANVLIVEYPRTQAGPMADMVGALLAGQGRSVSPAMQRTLAELSRN